MCYDNRFEVKGVFLEISQAFDKVWHEGIIFKLKQNDISSKMLSVLSDLLKDRKQSYFKWGSFFMDSCKRRCLSGINFGSTFFWFISMIWLMAYHQTQNYLQMIHLYFWLATMSAFCK